MVDRLREAGESPIKLVHMVLSIVVVIVTIVSTGGGVIWAIATYRSDTAADIREIKASVNTLATAVKESAQQTRENREYLLEHKADIDALGKRRDAPPTPVFPNRYNGAGVDR